MRVDRVAHAKRPDAGAHLHRRLVEVAERPRIGEVGATPVAELGGFALEAGSDGRDGSAPGVLVAFPGIPVEDLRFSREELAGVDPAGLVARPEHRLRGLEDTLATARQDLERTTSEAAAARARLGAPFPQEERLAALRRRQAEIEQALTPADPEPAPAETPPAPGVVSRAYPKGPTVSAASKLSGDRNRSPEPTPAVLDRHR